VSLGNRPHFQPVAQDHDRRQGCEFPPDFDLEQAESSRQRCAERNRDPQADEGHHAGLTVSNLAPRPTYKNDATVKKDNCSESWGNEF
jgi:hypothetical protein